MKLISTITIITETCCECGVIFGLNEGHRKSLKESGGTFYCSNGHSQHYTYHKSLEQKIAAKDKLIQELSCRVDLCESKKISLMCDYRFKMYLDNSGVVTVGDALNLGEEGLLCLFGIGKKCIEQINNSLSLYNVRLK